MKLTTHLYLVLSLGTSGALRPLPHTYVWCVQGKLCILECIKLRHILHLHLHIQDI
jgi:hypothetical protein